jgi:hypothetical protein
MMTQEQIDELDAKAREMLVKDPMCLAQPCAALGQAMGAFAELGDFETAGEILAIFERLNRAKGNPEEAAKPMQDLRDMLAFYRAKHGKS